MRWNILLAAMAAAAWILTGCEQDSQTQAAKEFVRYQLAHAQTGKGGARTATQPAVGKGADAMTRLSDRPTLADYLAYAALNNPGLEAAFNRWKAAIQRVPQARALNDPEFSYRYWIIPVPLRDGDMRHVYEISQELPFPGKLELRGQIASAEADAAGQRFEMERIKLFNRVKQAYYEYYYLGRALAVTRDSLARLREIEGVALARYRTGGSSAPDVLRLRVEVGKLENEFASGQDLRQPTAAKLIAAINKPPESQLPVPDQLEGREVDIDEVRLLAWMKEGNPELKALGHEVAREKKSIALAGKDFFPDVTVGFEYDQMFDAPGVDSSDMRDQVAASISLNVPIWHEKYAAGVREAQHRAWAADKEKAERANSLATEVRLSAYNFRNAERKIALYRDSLLPSARQSLDSVQAGYQTGTSAFSDFIDSQRVLLEFHLSYERAVVDRMQSLADLEAMVGRVLPAGAATTRPADQP